MNITYKRIHTLPCCHTRASCIFSSSEGGWFIVAAKSSETLKRATRIESLFSYPLICATCHAMLFYEAVTSINKKSTNAAELYACPTVFSSGKRYAAAIHVIGASRHFPPSFHMLQLHVYYSRELSHMLTAWAYYSAAAMPCHMRHASLYLNIERRRHAMPWHISFFLPFFSFHLYMPCYRHHRFEGCISSLLVDNMNMNMNKHS